MCYSLAQKRISSIFISTLFSSPSEFIRSNTQDMLCRIIEWGYMKFSCVIFNRRLQDETVLEVWKCLLAFVASVGLKKNYVLTPILGNFIINVPPCILNHISPDNHRIFPYGKYKWSKKRIERKVISIKEIEKMEHYHTYTAPVPPLWVSCCNPHLDMLCKDNSPSYWTQQLLGRWSSRLGHLQQNPIKGICFDFLWDFLNCYLSSQSDPM